MAEEEAAAVFFIGIGGAEGTAAVRPTVLDGGRPATAVLVALLAGADATGAATDFAGLTGFATVAALADGVAGFFGALFSFVAGAFAAEVIFFAAGTAGFAATAFLAAGLVAGVALAAGFFTVTGSLNELERAFTGCLLPRDPLRLSSRMGSTRRSARSDEPRGYTPESPPETCGAPYRKPHPVVRTRAWLPEQARDCIENSK